MVNQLSVTREEAEEEVRKSNGPYARYTWLLKVAEDMTKIGKTKKVARAFLLRLVGMTIFYRKTNNKVMRQLHTWECFGLRKCWGVCMRRHGISFSL